MMSLRNSLVFVLLACAAGAQSSAPARSAPGRIETKTRLVAVFSDLNARLFQAIQKRDSVAFQRLLGEDFELRTAAAPAAVQSSEEWEKAAFARNLESFHISQMAVRGLQDEVAIVSFVLRENYKELAGASQFFVVEAWTMEGDHWLCQEAYLSPSKAAPPVTVKDRKPTGKE